MKHFFLFAAGVFSLFALGATSLDAQDASTLDFKAVRDASGDVEGVDVRAAGLLQREFADFAIIEVWGGEPYASRFVKFSIFSTIIQCELSEGAFKYLRDNFRWGQRVRVSGRIVDTLVPNGDEGPGIALEKNCQFIPA